MESCASRMKCKIWNVCRCCLTADRSRCSRNIFSEYLIGGRSEVYQDMLKDTFNIHISQESKLNHNTLICDDCIVKLQQASSFKDMVVQAERMYATFLDGIQHYDDKQATDVVLESFKAESVLDEDDVKCDDHSSLDDEPLSFIKQEIKYNKQSTDDTELTVKQKMVHEESKGRRNVEKISRSTDDMKSDDDWTKLTDRRGNGPILRENSLKLLKNSTICVFQWYKSKYTCFCCQTPFTDIHKLRNHTATEHTLKDVEKKIISQQNMLVKVEVSIIKCKLCNKELENLQKLREHLTLDHNFVLRLKEDLLVPFKIGGDLKCQICSENFSVFRLLNIHMNKHYQKQVCHICGAVFSNLKFLNLHKTRLHRRWYCNECKEEYQTKAEKRKHDVAIHKIKSIRKLRFPCPHCDERFFQESLKILHLVNKHGLKRPEHKCSVCPKIFVTRGLCNNHIKTVHMKEKRHSCDVCHNRFYTNSDVMRHQVTHTGEKKISCGVCNGPFATKDSLRRHMKRTHSVH